MIGYYYLHTNGDLIFKNNIVVESDPEYFDSPFVKKHWKFNTEERLDGWTICIEALALGARKERVFELKEKWGLTNEDAKAFAKRVNMKVYNDGSSWCATFNDLKEKNKIGFGDTALEAFADLIKK